MKEDKKTELEQGNNPDSLVRTRLQKEKVSFPSEIPAACCPRCGVAVSGGTFCGECGEPLAAKSCPRCHKPTSPLADICESCGEWLLPDKCKFCGSDVTPGSTYCSDCGNPLSGIVCRRCNTTSFFDFCPRCHLPLTEAARMEAEQLRKAPEQAELFRLLEKVESGTGPEKQAPDQASDSLPGIVADLQALSEKSTSKDFFDRDQREMAVQAADQVDNETMLMKAKTTFDLRRNEAALLHLEEERKREQELEERRQRQWEEELRAKKEAELAKLRVLLADTAKKKFGDNQSARRFHESCRPTKAKGWKCNFSGSVHDGPDNCQEPWHGGHWVV